METRKISIYDLKPAEYNPRVMSSDEMDKLTTSLRTFGLVDPIIIDLTDNNTIIGGHQRYEALIQLDEEDLTLIPLGDIGLVINETSIRIKDKNDQKALNLALNKIQGGWDYDLLDNIITELTRNNYDIELTGFDEIEFMLDSDSDIEAELNKGISEWDKHNNTTEDEFKEKNNSTMRLYYEENDIIKIGTHEIKIGSTSNQNYTLSFKDELIITTTPENIQKIKQDNETIYNRTKIRENKNTIRRKLNK